MAGAKFKNRADSMEEFEFLDASEDTFECLDCDSSGNSIPGAVQKLGSGVALIFSALCNITEEQGLTVSVPVKVVATTAATTITGSLIGGVPGMAVGLITGAYLAYRKSPTRASASDPTADSNKKFSLKEVFAKMTMEQKKDLLKELFSCLKQSNVRLLVYELCKNDQIRGIAIQILSDFLYKKMGVKLTKTKV